MNKIAIGKYKHYKGGIYEVLHAAKHNETMTEMVVYRALHDDHIWVRPATEWNRTVFVDKKAVKRYELLD